MFDRSPEAKNATIARQTARKAKQSVSEIYNEFAIFADELFTNPEEAGVKAHDFSDER